MLARCAVCAAKFAARPHHIRIGQGRYCSLHCSGIARTKVYDVWDHALTTETAWALGLIASDGSICKRAGIKLAVSPIDSELCYKIQAIVGGGTVRTYQLATWYLRSVYLAKRLRELGYTERKGRELRWPALPSKVTNDFLRGYWDGDGSFGRMRHAKSGIAYPIAQITSMSQDFIEGLARYLGWIAGSKAKPLRTRRGYWQLFYGGKPARQLARSLYAQAKPSCRLERKWRLAMSFCVQKLGGRDERAGP